MGRVFIVVVGVVYQLSAIAIAAPAQASSPTLIQVSSDQLTNTGSGVQHQTEVETASFSHASTIVSSFQVGRYSSFGSAAMGFATSTDNGSTWTNGLLPGLTANSPNPDARYPRVVNQSVAYDARHDTWLIPTVGVVACPAVAAGCTASGFREDRLFVSRSSNGAAWTGPVTAVANNVDKAWGVCDNSLTSPYFGNCYIAYAQIQDNLTLALVTSSDGGLTWSKPVTTTSRQVAYNTNPTVQANGTLVVVATDRANGLNGSAVLAFTSTDGGATLSDSSAVDTVRYHVPGGGIRGHNKPSVDVDAAGTVYAAWGDCRYRSGCAENDIVVASSADGVHWSSPGRVAADAASSTVDHFLPGLAVRPGTSGPDAEIGVIYYSYPVANCTTATCALDVHFTSSTDSGATWADTKLNPTSMNLQWLPTAPGAFSPGYMPGDYNKVAYTNGRATMVFPLATAPVSGSLRVPEVAATMPLTNAGNMILGVTGSGQTAPVGTRFGGSLSASVTDNAGGPVAGVAVTFVAPTSGASGTFASTGINTATSVTDGAGIATAPDMTANAAAGAFTVTATAPGATSTARFRLANAGPVASIIGNAGITPQSARAGTAFGNVPAVTVVDGAGDPVPGASVTFSAPAVGPSAMFDATGTSTATLTTNALGVARAPLTANDTTGSYTVTVGAGAATLAGGLSLTNVGAPTTVVASGPPQSATVGTTFTTPLTATVTDAAGRAVPGVDVVFAGPASGPGATFAPLGSGTSATTNTNGSGVASTSLKANLTAGTYNISVSVAGLAPVSYGLTNLAGAPTKLLVSAGNNQVATVGTAFATSLKSTLTDAYNNPVSGAPVTYTAPASGPTATFATTSTNTATVSTSATGGAVAPTLTADANPGGYRVTATAGALSANFNLTNQAVNAPPTASFALSCLNLSCSFDATASADTDGTIVAYSWDFGDETTATGTSPSHTYSAARDYTVALTVTDDRGAAGSTAHTASPPGPSISSVSGGAFAYYTNVGLSGGPQSSMGPDPTVTLPSNGGGQSAADPDGATAAYGSRTVFENHGASTVQTDGTTGTTGSVISSAQVTDIQPQAPFTAAAPGGVTSTCSADGTRQRGSTTITNGRLVLQDPDTSMSGEPGEVAVTPPTDPPPGTEYSGVVGGVNDYFTIVLNEQRRTPDAITVNAVHLYLQGPTAVGDVIIGQSQCGVVSTSADRGPVAKDDTYTTGVGQALTVPAPGLLANDSDPDGDPMSAAKLPSTPPPPSGTTCNPYPQRCAVWGSPSTPANGTVLLNSDGSFTYTPNAGFAGTDAFAYTTSDARGRSGNATVMITVTSASYLSINDAWVNEGNSGSTAANISITRSGNTTGVSSVKFKTTNGTANAGSDYSAIALTTVTFAPGEVVKPISVIVTGDTAAEANETFNVVLSNQTGASLSDTTGVGTIVNDDLQSYVSVNDAVVSEGNAGTTAAMFTVTRSGNTSGPSTVSYKTTDATATASTDYTAIPLTSVTFAPGETTKSVSVSVTGDTVDEVNEAFTVSLSLPVQAVISDSIGTATIVDDDGPIVAGPTTFFAVGDVSITEGTAGTTPATFVVTRFGDLSGTSSVKYTTADATAIAPGDYTAKAVTTLSFAPGESTKEVNVDVAGDTGTEIDETFRLTLSGPVGAVIADSSGTATIVNDDFSAFSVTDVSVTEGNAGTVVASFTITRAGNTSGAATVSYKTLDSSATAASGDYSSAPLTPVSFAAGVSFRTVSVAVTGDTNIEPNETFTVNLSSPIGGVISDISGTGTIVNDD